MPAPYAAPFSTEDDAVAAIAEQLTELGALAKAADALDTSLSTDSKDPAVQQAFGQATAQARGVVRSNLQTALRLVAGNFRQIGAQVAPDGVDVTPSTEPAPVLPDKAAVQAAIRSLASAGQDAIAELEQDPPAIEAGQSTHPRILAARQRGAEGVEKVRATVAREELSIVADELDRIAAAIPSL